MSKDKWVYIVCQTQTSEDYYDYPIYVLTNRKQADKYAQELNKQYAYGVELDKDNNFVRVNDDFESGYHYYNVLPMKLNERLA